MTSKIAAASSLLKSRGLNGTIKTVYKVCETKAKIFAMGQNGFATLDGCRYDLRDVPNTRMKLELLKGTYEQLERTAAQQFIRPEWPVVELGACIGGVSCVTNKLLNNPRAHVVVEANPLVIPLLESNRRQNGCSFKIVNAALAYHTATVTFSPWFDFWGNSIEHQLASSPPVTVPAVRLEQILDDEQFDGYALLCDIEGQECELVMNEPDAVQAARVVIMETHPDVTGIEKVATMLERMAALGFETMQQSGDLVVFGRA
jgi:FkbM family methyltransferase